MTQRKVDNQRDNEYVFEPGAVRYEPLSPEVESWWDKCYVENPANPGLVFEEGDGGGDREAECACLGKWFRFWYEAGLVHMHIPGRLASRLREFRTCGVMKILVQPSYQQSAPENGPIRGEASTYAVS